MKTTVVTTTIHVPTFLKAYAENAKHFGQEVDFIVIGDRKTPEGAQELCDSMDNCVYWGLSTQAAWLRQRGFHALLEHLPIDSISRSNIGYLLAYVRGAEVVIMLDDDNLSIPDQDFVQHHTLAGKCESIHMFQSHNGWFNVCKALEEVHEVEFYARGYPPAQRWMDAGYALQCRAEKVAVNAGLWTNDPDIDAITRLERRLITTGMKPNWPASFALRSSTWSPWNCQNTAISRAALPSYFLSPHLGRHSDIWASYITTRIAEANDEVIAFGLPLARHERSPHNLYRDLEQELPWIQETDDFCTALRAISVPSTGYLDGLAAVIEGLDNLWKPQPPQVVLAKQRYLEGLSIWHRIFAGLRP